MSANEAPSKLHTPTRESKSGDAVVLVCVALVPLALTFLLRLTEVPLGKPGTFTYLYSPDGIFERRVAQLPAALAIAVALACSIWLLCDSRRLRCVGGYALLCLGLFATGVWSLVAPPQWRSQLYFNMSSPSHDGAFLEESARLDPPGGALEYVRHFPERAGTRKEVMRGTRVISNPPGTTLLAYTMRDWSARSTFAKGAIDRLLAGEPPEVRSDFRLRAALPFAFALQGIWLVGAVLFFFAARQLLDAPLAAALAVIVAVCPATLMFTPGKDPAQLCLVAVQVWLGVRAWRDGGWVAAAGFGVVSALAAFVGLVHIWVAILLAVAARFAWRRGGLASFALRYCLPAGCGALGVAFGLWLVWRVDLLGIIAAVAKAQSAVTRGPESMPWFWQTLGIPLYALFAGPALWFVALRGGKLEGVEAGPRAGCPHHPESRAECPRHPDAGRFGRALVVATAALMVVTVGFTNAETPRLWMPFQWLLLLGLTAYAAPRLNRRADRATLLAAVVLIHVAASAIQWSMMDMREAENRLLLSQDEPARFFE